jgi:hypothetical protein
MWMSRRTENGSLAPRVQSAKLQSAGLNFFSDKVHQNPLGFEPSQLSKDTGLGSGGEDYGSSDNLIIDNRGEMEGFCVWFLNHFGRIIILAVA